MGIKSKGNYKIPFCIKKCRNRDIFCNICIRFSQYQELMEPSKGKYFHYEIKNGERNEI